MSENQRVASSVSHGIAMFVIGTAGIVIWLSIFLFFINNPARLFAMIDESSFGIFTHPIFLSIGIISGAGFVSAVIIAADALAELAVVLLNAIEKVTQNG